MIVVTQSGSVYRCTETTIARMHVGKASQPLRQDGLALTVLQWVKPPVVGERMIVAMEPLLPAMVDGANVTFRITSKVVNIDESDDTEVNALSLLPPLVD